jgi:pimeloyl-ACP methyl ester carboxylesterase
MLPNSVSAEYADVRIEKAYVPGPWGQIHYYAAGAGPCLILAHQSPVCGRMFEQALPRLAARGIRAIAVDTPGYGMSDVPQSPPALSEYADSLIAVLDNLGLERAHFLGHHTGAGIVCNFAARHSDRVDKLVLNGPPLFDASELEKFKDFELGPDSVREDGSHLLKAWERRVQFTPGWSSAPAMHRRLIDQLWAGDTWWYGHRAAFEYLMEADLLALACPTLILTNTGDDLYGCSQKAHRMRPDFAYVELEGGTHDIVDEQPDAWVASVADFVKNRG